MSSLPQGWHGIPGPSKVSSASAAVTASSVPTTIRKKWNSPLSSEIPKSKLPSYKPSNLKLKNIRLENSNPWVSGSKASCPGSQSVMPTSSTKSSTQDKQNEVERLKKELASMKAENSILKAKVRRVDDENAQKSRQIEKLQAELKAVQKNESIASQKSKDSDLLLLRQKCLRLEGALKEKDLVIKKLNNKIAEELNDKTEIKGSKKELGLIDSSKKQNCCGSKNNQKSLISAHSKLSRTSQSLKTEVMKLRDMIHKLEKENQELQHQAKENGQEIRRLKMQLRSKDRVSSVQTFSHKSTPAESSKVTKVKSTSSVPNLEKCNFKKVKPSLLNHSSSNTVKSSIEEHATPLSTSKTVQRIPGSLKTVPRLPESSKTVPRLRGSIRMNPQKQGIVEIKINKSVGSRDVKKHLLTSKQTPQISSAQSNATFVISKHSAPKTSVKPQKIIIIPENNLTSQVQEMRENIAAKKIQRSWRDHRKRISFGNEPQSELQKAITFIVSSIKHHRLRKDKLIILTKKRNSMPRLMEDCENTFIQAIQAGTKKVWEKEIKY